MFEIIGVASTNGVIIVSQLSKKIKMGGNLLSSLEFDNVGAQQSDSFSQVINELTSDKFFSRDVVIFHAVTKEDTIKQIISADTLAGLFLIFNNFQNNHLKLVRTPFINVALDKIQDILGNKYKGTYRKFRI
jgi:hypothetical protein